MPSIKNKVWITTLLYEILKLRSPEFTCFLELVIYELAIEFYIDLYGNI